MRFIADLHIHSRFSRATSKEMDIPTLSEYAKRKGIALLGTGDFTHPVWLKELENLLKPDGNGLFQYNFTHFILTTEVCNIFYSKDIAKKIHNIIFCPSFESVHKINNKLQRYGELLADGRPILNLPARDLVKMVMDIDQNCFIIPSHIWTPHFSLFGSNSGFNDITECFGDMTRYIFALETGLSSNPKMNWRWSKLDRFSLISNSDAHSPWKLGREANIFDTEMDYFSIRDALKNKDKNKFIATIEFFPEEGKYHWDGHRFCNVNISPKESILNNNLCPVCKRPLTIGVMHRVEELCDRPEGFIPESAIPYYNLVPLTEIMAQIYQKQAESAIIKEEFNNITSTVGTEMEILMDLSEDELYKKLPKELAKAILHVRNGKVDITPGYDGVYGKVEVKLEDIRSTSDIVQMEMQLW